MEPPCITQAHTHAHTIHIHQNNKQKNAHIPEFHHNFMIVKAFELIINNDRANAINILNAIFCSFGLHKNRSHSSTCIKCIICVYMYTHARTHEHPTLCAVIFVALSLY